MKYLIAVLFLASFSAQAAEVVGVQKLEDKVWVFDWSIRPTKISQTEPYSNEVYDCKAKVRPCADTEDEAKKLAKDDAETREKR